MTDPVARLKAACDRDLGEPALWSTPNGYPTSLALCAIDSIYSTASHYGSVVKVVQRYVTYRRDQGGDASADGLTELLGTFDELGGSQSWSERIGNRKKVSTRPGAALKSDAIEEASRSLLALGIDTTADLRSAVSAGAGRPKQAWLAAPGQRSGLTWGYALMLVGVPGVKADRMVVRYVARALGVGDVTPRHAASLAADVAVANGWNVIHLDHAIWRFESGRAVNEDVR